jgi:hypothetical protein
MKRSNALLVVAALITFFSSGSAVANLLCCCYSCNVNGQCTQAWCGGCPANCEVPQASIRRGASMHDPDVDSISKLAHRSSLPTGVPDLDSTSGRVPSEGWRAPAGCSANRAGR